MNKVYINGNNWCMSKFCNLKSGVKAKGCKSNKKIELISFKLYTI